MLKTNLVLSLGLAGLVACTAGNGSDDDMMGDDGDPDPGGVRGTVSETGVSTLAGWSEPGYKDGNRQINLFNNPVNCAFKDGKVYVADFDNSKIRVVDGHGNSTTLVSKQGFSRPFGMAFVGDTLYVGTDRDCTGMGDPIESTARMYGAIWKVDVNAKAATCLIDKIGRPRGLTALGDGRLAVSDFAHHVVQIFDPNSRALTVLAGARDVPGAADGQGAAASFNQPYGIVLATSGKLIVADWANHKIRVVGLDGTVSTLGGSTAGFADGGMASAKFNHPQGVAIASNGEVIITDIDNFRVRRIPADASSVSTIAGSGTGGVKDSTNPAEAQFYGGEGVCVAPDAKTIFVPDGARGESMPYNRLRIIKL